MGCLKFSAPRPLIFFRRQFLRFAVIKDDVSGIACPRRALAIERGRGHAPAKKHRAASHRRFSREKFDLCDFGVAVLPAQTCS